MLLLQSREGLVRLIQAFRYCVFGSDTVTGAVDAVALAYVRAHDVTIVPTLLQQHRLLKPHTGDTMEVVDK